MEWQTKWPRFVRVMVLLIASHCVLLAARFAVAEDADVAAKLQILGAKCYFEKDLFDPKTPMVVIDVVIAETWTGGDEGLHLIKDLKMVRRLHLAGHPKVSQDAIAKLRKEFRQIEITRRSSARFGISGSTYPRGCVVRHVLEDTPAEMVGLEVGDTIIKFAGTPIPDFETFTAVMVPLKPGDKVQVVFRRGETEHSVEAVLDAWRLFLKWTNPRSNRTASAGTPR